MKPRNFITNILLMIMFVAYIILVLVAKSIDWKMIFIGIAGIVILIPDLFLKPKHKVGFLVYKSIAQVEWLTLIVISAILGFIFVAAFGVAEGIAQGCGGTVSHNELDKFVANFTLYMFIPLICKVVMNVVDFILYRKELNGQKQNILEEND